MNLGQVTADILAGQRAVREGYEQGQREQRLKVAVADAACELRLAAPLAPAHKQDRLREVARELGLAYSAVRK